MCKRSVQALFVAACVTVDWYAWSSWSDALPQYRNEALIIPTVLLYAVTFPAGLVFQLIYTALAQITPIGQLNAGTAFWSWMLATWVPLTAIGFLQWFFLVPRLV